MENVKHIGATRLMEVIMDNDLIEISLYCEETDDYEHYGYYKTIDEAVEELLTIKQNLEV